MRRMGRVAVHSLPLLTFALTSRSVVPRILSLMRQCVALMVAVGCTLVESSDRPVLNPDVPFDQHTHRDYFARDGLPSSWINDVLQTNDGFLWIATDNGLVRFDGLKFSTFDRNSNPQLPASETRVLYECREGSLWIGTTSGLACYRRGRPPAFEDIPGFPRTTVFAIQEDRSGTLWVGTLHGTYVRKRELQFELVKDAPTNVRAICEDPEGTLWLGSNDGLFRRTGESYIRMVHEFLPERTAVTDSLPMSRVNVIRRDARGGLWIGANRALLYWKDGAFQREGRELGRQQVYDVLEAADGSLYAAARFGLYRSHAGGMFEKVSDKESAFCLIQDTAGSLWAGHGDNRGLQKYSPNPAETVWNTAKVFCVYRDKVGDLWVGTANGLQHFHDGNVEIPGGGNGLPSPEIQTIVPGTGDTLWLGTAKGFVKWSNHAAIEVPVPAILPDMNVSTALEDSSGNMWIGLATAGGHVLRKETLSDLSSLNSGRIHWFCEDRQGVVWIGHETGLYQDHSGEILPISDPALDVLQEPRFLCHWMAGDDTLWIGTSNGIARVRSGKLEAFPPECGLQADNIERIAADNRGNLWFGGRDGLFHAPIEKFDAFARGDLKRIATFRVEGFDRFPPVPAFSQGCAVDDQSVWIVGERGLSRIPIDRALVTPKTPDVLIEHVLVDGKEIPFDHGFSYSSGRQRLMLEFAMATVEFPQQIQVRYRVDGHDADWIGADGDYDAHYTDMRPGDYSFRLEARRGNGEWMEAEPVQFTVQPRWWETWLFQVASLAACLGLILIGAEFRTRRVQAANETLRREIRERERAEAESRQRQAELARVSRAASMGELTTSIAHEVKQPLFAIVSNAQSARRLLDADPPDIQEVREALGDIASDGDRASRIIDHVRSLVKKSQPPACPLQLSEIARRALQLFQPEVRRRGLTIDVQLAADLPEVRGSDIELEQVILNFLFNAAQAMDDQAHQGLPLILKTSLLDDAVELSVEDHGTGTEEKNLNCLFEPFFTTKPEGTGMGLAINRTIIQGHGGRIWATRNDNGGMTFHFSLPVRRNATR